MQQAGVTRRRRTARQLAVGEQSRRVQAVSWQAKRAARLEELGSADLGVYLRRRYLDQVWPLKRMRPSYGWPQLAGGADGRAQPPVMPWLGCPGEGV
jgi:hypothetical protein